MKQTSPASNSSRTPTKVTNPTPELQEQAKNAGASAIQSQIIQHCLICVYYLPQPNRSEAIILRGVSRMKQTSPASNSSRTPTKVTNPTPELQEQVRRRAHEKYEQRGRE